MIDYRRSNTLRAALLWMCGSTGVIVVSGVLIWLLIATIESGKPSPVSVPATPAPEVKRETKRPVTVKAPVQVYRPEVKAKLRLPPDALTNQSEQVLAATQVKSSDRPQTVTTTLDTETGESRTYVKQDPLPWFAIEPRGAVQLAMGYKARNIGNVQPVTRLTASYDVVRVKALTAGVTASVDSDGHTFAGVGITYRW